MTSRSYWRSRTRLIKPIGRPIDVNDVKEQLGLSCYNKDNDRAILRKIDAAVETCEDYQGRAYCEQTRRMAFDCFEHHEILLPTSPVIGDVTITIIDPQGQSQSLTSGVDFQVDTFAEPGRVMPAYGKSWPATRSQTYNAVVVTWKAGFASVNDIPSATKEVIIMMAADLFLHPESQGETSLSQNKTWQDMLNKDRVIWS